MDASVDRGAPLTLIGPGRFTKVAINTAAGEIEARMSEAGNWELRLRKEDEESWRIACRGDLDSGAFTAEPARRDALVRGPLVVEPEARTARVGDVILNLAKKEFALLVALATKPDRVFSKEELLAAIWDYTGTEVSRRVDTHASKLRRKLRAAGADGMVINCWGVGYRLWDRPDVVALPPLQTLGAAA
ncbi:MAG TPA: winged helix-turn-helix domain-containing protein [Solirubrobacterales bacterium]|nr:winged helix-turn-helix domain-containing protein [Solirubrobacterales bacterium]